MTVGINLAFSSNFLQPQAPSTSYTSNVIPKDASNNHNDLKDHAASVICYNVCGIQCYYEESCQMLVWVSPKCDDCNFPYPSPCSILNGKCQSRNQWMHLIFQEVSECYIPIDLPKSYGSGQNNTMQVGTGRVCSHDRPKNLLWNPQQKSEVISLDFCWRFSLCSGCFGRGLALFQEQIHSMNYRNYKIKSGAHIGQYCLFKVIAQRKYM